MSFPIDIKEQEVFQQRTFHFFSYSISNMMGLIYGAGLIALVLYVYGAEKKLIVLLFLMTSAIAIVLIFVSRYVLRKKPEKNELVFFLRLRIFLGCLIGLMYALAVTLLPDKNIELGILLLLSIYLVSIAIAIFQYSVIPIYYILFNISIFLPLTVYLLYNPNETSVITIVLLLSGIILFVSKGLKVSKNVIDSIEVNLALQAEIAEHVITRQKLREMALYDNLTSIANRYLLEEHAAAYIHKASGNGQQIAFLFIDLNDFKQINDQYGHDIGDKVLIEATENIKNNIRATDFVARLGGDEFVVILESYNLDKININLIESIQISLNKNIEIDGSTIKLRASIGTAIYPHDGDNLKTLLHNADISMYKEKCSSKS
ncbi:MAG: GGDEF domain-containing protein [Colwellia sp.]|nr:GGDEF domain-containing protein [Colwellia sp.]